MLVRLFVALTIMAAGAQGQSASTTPCSNASGCLEGLCSLQSYMWITSRRVVRLYSRPRASAIWRASLETRNRAL
jgi:hypothetical protein